MGLLGRLVKCNISILSTFFFVIYKQMKQYAHRVISLYLNSKNNIEDANTVN